MNVGIAHDHRKWIAPTKLFTGVSPMVFAGNCWIEIQPVHVETEALTAEVPVTGMGVTQTGQPTMAKLSMQSNGTETTVMLSLNGDGLRDLLSAPHEDSIQSATLRLHHTIGLPDAGTPRPVMDIRFSEPDYDPVNRRRWAQRTEDVATVDDFSQLVLGKWIPVPSVTYEIDYGNNWYQVMELEVTEIVREMWRKFHHAAVCVPYVKPHLNWQVRAGNWAAFEQGVTERSILLSTRDDGDRPYYPPYPVSSATPSPPMLIVDYTV